MASIDPAVMLAQVDCLADELPVRAAAADAALRHPADGPRWSAVGRVLLVGAGDSCHAALACEPAFTAFAGVVCTALPVQRFLDTQAPWLGRADTVRTLVIGSSASGTTERVAQCLAAARAQGALTLAITGDAESPVARAAEWTLPVEPLRRERSPGILSYQATRVALLSTAVRLGEARGALGPGAGDRLRAELRASATVVARTNQGIAEDCRLLAERLADPQVIAVLGSGPNEGTARYGAAKLVEGAGVFAYGQDLEEWWHVERFARPLDGPLFVLAPAGRSQDRALRLARDAAGIGRRVTLLTDDPQASARADGCTVLAAAAPVREEFSPLVHHLFAARISAHLAQRLGRRPFLGDLAG
jgi:glucosamine--fructose-6-phosphate aminotransferase (isomerizing)